MSQHVFELNQSVNNREVSFKVGKSIIEYSKEALSNHLYPLLSITIDDIPYELIRESLDYPFQNTVGPTSVLYQSDKYINISMNNTTGSCVIKGYGDHTIKIVGMKTTHDGTWEIVPEKTVNFEW